MQTYIRYAGGRIRQCGGDQQYDTPGCGGVITAGSPIVRGFWWHNKMRHYKSWHFDCWVRGAKEWFKANPHIPKVRGTKGRKPMEGTPEENKRRHVLLVYASQIRREKHEQLEFLFNRGHMADFNHQASEFNVKLKSIWDQLLELGGPPKSSFAKWVEYSPRKGLT